MKKRNPLATGYTRTQDDVRIERLIRQLGSPNFCEREDASSELEALGDRAYEALQKAASGKELEIRHRARELVKKIDAKRHERLHQLLTVSYGDTEVTDEKAQKVVRIIDQHGQGIKDVLIEVGFESSRDKLSFRSNKDGQAIIKSSKGTSLCAYAEPVEVYLQSWVMKFPIEITVWRRGNVHKNAKKNEAPRSRECLHQPLTVSYGDTEVTDEKAQKVVRIIDQYGRGVRNAEIIVGPSKKLLLFKTDKDGLSTIKADKIRADNDVWMTIYPGTIRARLLHSAIRFPVEVVFTKPEG